MVKSTSAVWQYVLGYIAVRTKWKWSGFGKNRELSYGMYLCSFPIQQTISMSFGGSMSSVVNFLLSMPFIFLGGHIVEYLYRKTWILFERSRKMFMEDKLMSMYSNGPLWLQRSFTGLSKLAACVHIDPHHQFLKMALDDWKDREPENPDLAETLAYVKKTKRWTMFPGEYEKKYHALKINVDRSEDGFPFVLVNGKKLFFPKRFGKSWTAETFKGLLREQDPESPHCYFSDQFPPPHIGREEILLDIGAAEAIISLQYVEQVKHTFIFECDDGWIEALHKTFYPYRDKVTIIQKYVSDNNEDNCVRLDDYIKNCQGIDGLHEHFIVKMDIEGAETKALEGSSELLRCKRSRFVICTYHQPGDAQEFDRLFQALGYQTQFPKNYMLYGGGNFGKPSFRKGVIQAWCDTQI